MALALSCHLRPSNNFVCSVWHRIMPLFSVVYSCRSLLYRLRPSVFFLFFFFGGGGVVFFFTYICHGNIPLFIVVNLFVGHIKPLGSDGNEHFC